MIFADPTGDEAELSEPVILAVANWTRDTALLYGSSISTAFFCAAHMAAGLEALLRSREEHT